MTVGGDDLTLEDAAEALSYVDPHPHETWYQMGMALRSHFGDAALETWLAWSAQASNYREKDARSRWRTFRPGGRIGIGSLIHEAKAAGWQPRRRELTPEERERWRKEQAERQRARREEAAREAEHQRQWHERVSALATAFWEQCVKPTGRSQYLGRKKVRAHGVGFVRRAAIVVVDERDDSTRLITGPKAINEFYKEQPAEIDGLSFRHIKPGTIVLPMRARDDRIWNLQIIWGTGSKKFLRHGRKRGTYHLIGDWSASGPAVLCEGYATGASVHEATGWPVVVCWDSGNLVTVARDLAEAGEALSRWVIAADDDHESTLADGTPHNAGMLAAEQAAASLGAVVAAPRFGEPAGRTDWNDLHVEQGLAAVREQLAAALDAAPAADSASESAEAQPGYGGEGTPPPPGDPPWDDEEPPTPEPPSVSGNWRERLNVTEKGGTKPTLHNVVLILEHDERWQGVYCLDEFANQILRTRRTPYGYEPGEVVDSDGGELACWISDPFNYGVPIASKTALEALEMVARRRAFHPVRRYLDGLEWDGEERLDRLFSDFFGARHDEYTATVGRNWLLSAVARVRDPGCKVDFMVILEGDQGRGKSTAVRTLCGAQWFAETMESPQSKDFFQVLTGRWMVEIPELQSFNKADRNRIKAVLSSQEDTYRPSYGRYARQFPRQTIIVGTTNDDNYLRDETGARRFLPVRVGHVDIEGLAQVRDQLWAEADHRYRKGEKFWEFPDQAAEEQDARFDVDAWEEPITEWLDGRAVPQAYPPDWAVTKSNPIRETTVAEVMTHALEVEVAKQSKPDQMRAGAVLRRLGWRRTQKRVHGRVRYVYQRPRECG